MRRLLAFSVGVATVVAGRAFLREPAGDPLPGPAEVRTTLRQLARQAPLRQRAAFADAHIDAAEYRAAVFARLECVQTRLDRSVEVHGPDPLAGGRLLIWRYRVEGDLDPRVGATDHQCAKEISGSIERAWRLEILPQGQSRAREVAQFAACLRRHSVPLDGHGVSAVLAGAAQADVPVGECADAHAVLFDL